MQQAGGKARQSNATGGKNASLHKINWCSINRCSGVNRVKSRWCLCAANPFEHSSYLLSAAGLVASSPNPPAVGPPDGNRGATRTVRRSGSRDAPMSRVVSGEVEILPGIVGPERIHLAEQVALTSGKPAPRP